MNSFSNPGHGEDLNHLIWDVKNTRDVFETLKPVGLDPDHISRFVITDGGVTMFKPHKYVWMILTYDSNIYDVTNLTSWIPSLSLFMSVFYSPWH